MAHVPTVRAEPWPATNRATSPRAMTPAEYLRATADAMLEAALQTQVERLLTAHRWRWYHAPDNRPGRNGRVQRVRAGFPDLVALRDGAVLVAELKRQREKPRPDQVEWLDDWTQAGARVHVWRPLDLLTGRIEEALR